MTEVKGEEVVLFDVIEYLDCIIDKYNCVDYSRSGKYLVEEINGEIKMECNLSGTPELYIFLS